MKRRLLVLSFAFGFAVAAMAYSDGELSLGEPLPFAMDGSALAPREFYPIVTASISTNGVPSAIAVGPEIAGAGVYTLRAHSAGMTISEQVADYSIGDFLTLLPRAVDQIDWDGTLANIMGSQSFRAGLVTAIPSTTNAYEAVLFTGGGAVSIDWKFTDGATETKVYQVKEFSSKRPYRLFWTSAPFNGPIISLSGKSVRLFGPTDILTCTYEVDPKTQVSNVVTGVYYDESSKLLRAAAKVIDYDSGSFAGPHGQFVLCYYTSGKKDQYVGHVVVEVSGPDVKIVNSHVGDELLPTGDGWGIQGLLPYINRGVEEEAGDAASPHITLGDYTHPVSGEKIRSVYAISPTDRTANSDGVDTPASVDIFWEKPDMMGTLWPFEEVWYLVSWNPNAPKMVFADGENGLTAFVPTNYQVKVCKYQAPAGTAVENGQVINLKKAGHFLLQLTEGSDKVWFAPFESVSRTDSRVCNADVSVDRVVPVGRRLNAIESNLAGTAADAFASVDATLPGYIYQGNGASAGRNWNPFLYHVPVHPTGLDTGTTLLSDENYDPFAALESSIYAVNAHESPIEIWWRGGTAAQSRIFGASKKIDHPVAVARYRVRAANDADWPAIVLASRLGSAGASRGTSERAIVLAGEDAAAKLSAQTPLDIGTEGCTVSFWLKPASEEMDWTTVTAGRVFTLDADAVGHGSKVVLSVDCLGATTGIALMEFCAADKESQTPLIRQRFSIDLRRWSPITLRLGPVENQKQTRGLHLWHGVSEPIGGEISTNTLLRAVADFGFGRAFNGLSDAVPAATGFALGGISVWNRSLDQKEFESGMLVPGSADDASQFFAWDFDSDSVLQKSEVGQEIVIDRIRRRHLDVSGGYGYISPGAPVRATAGVFPFADDVTPTVYRQPDKNGIGYHPNLAHAFTRLDDHYGCYATWALRSDLGQAGDTALVFTMYSDNGRGAMNTARVALTNEYYAALESTNTVGKAFLPPAPICYLDDYLNNSNQWCALTANAGADKQIVYRDRKNTDWARRAGGGFAFYYYPMRSDFDLPDGVSVGADGLLPWLSCLDGFKADKVRYGHPLAWYWHVDWPTEDVPTMYVGQTLTRAVNGLPDVYDMASCAVIYPRNDTSVRVDKVSRPASIAALVDPIQAQYAALEILKDFPSEYGFTVGSSGTCQLKKGQYTFSGLSPSLSKRFYIDTNAGESRRMVFIGALETPATGNPYLHPNVLSDEERQTLRNLCTLPDGNAFKAKWLAAVNALATEPVLAAPTSGTAPRVQWNNNFLPPIGDRRTLVNRLTRLETLATYGTADYWTNVVVTTENTGKDYVTHEGAFTPAYANVEKYALMATGNDAGYLVLIENDSTDTTAVPEGNPVDVKVIRIVPELYRGTITALTDSQNKLSEQLTIQYNEPFGAETAQYDFEWYRRGPEADGTVVEDPAQWGDPYRQGKGLVSFTIGTQGATLDVLGNKYYAMRYRAAAGTTAALTVGTDWSGWTDRTLAESWVQRVLNSVTPFAQRLEDFYSNASDLKYTMFEQIGRPYTGDVALNNDNLNNVGLIELYQTIFNKAEKMSIGIGASDADVNKQLLQAASRLSDLYQLLGAEAYADAKNPLISQGVSASFLAELQNLPSSTFCFQNQVPTLLDEELALLRGRSNATQSPNMKTAPYFNRLIWNFTKGITEGEVAYVNNYGISSNNGVVTVDTAAGQYPQGHGDAWGHYLSAMTGYYRLLRNPYFDWYASMMEMLVSQSVVNEDYYDENKFADAALKLAQTGLDTVDLTARKAWRDNGGDMMAAYFDEAKNTYANAEGGGSLEVRQAFGYGQFAVRAGLGAIYNWATVNSLLLTNAVADETYADAGIRKIDRTTVTQLPQLALVFGALQNKIDALDSGLNPIGLSQNAVSMDIDPSKLAEKNSHFDQILERAERALANCSKTLDYANQFGARLQQIQNAEGEATTTQKAQETAYRNQLIAIYGTPYSDDIGPGGLYDQGYDGPDLYHYNYMDLDQFGLGDEELRTKYYVTLTNKTYDVKTAMLETRDVKDGQIVVVRYEVTSGGIIKKPASFKGVRATEGSVQTAYRDYLDAYVSVDRARKSYDYKIDQLYRKYATIVRQYTQAVIGYGKDMTSLGFQQIYGSVKGSYDDAILRLTLADEIDEATMKAVTESLPDIQVTGVAVSVPVRGVANAAQKPKELTGKVATAVAKYVAAQALASADSLASISEYICSVYQLSVDLYDKSVAMKDTALSLVGEVTTAVRAYEDALSRLSAAEAAYRQEVYKGQLILEEREQWRKENASTATRLRYADMYNRIQRNNALTKYSTSFDIAQKYVWELAKVYDYETALLSSDSQAGDAFLAEIIGSRQLGYEGVSTSSATDKGLYDIVHRMKENWSVLRHRLGVDNPDTTTKWFSMRYSLFRLLRDTRGDEAWKDELAKYRVDNILDDPDFRRYCQPMNSSTVSVLKEPGLIIPFSTAINNRENFFGRTLMGGESAYSSSDYATKIHALGVKLAGYEHLTTESASGLALEPNIYLVPIGNDYMRAPAGTERKVIGFKVIDQVLPLPYAIGSTELDDTDYVASFQGMDGTSDSAAVIRRHSTLQADGSVYSTRLVGRSVWNDRWLLVIPASALNGVDPSKALERFIDGVNDIQIGIKAYSRNGN